MFLAYGVYGNTARRDNDHQVILCFDPEQFAAEAFDQNAPHLTGPKVFKKLFVYTGNTTYGVQNLEYDRTTGDYWMVVYQGKKEGFINTPLYIVDGGKAPFLQELRIDGAAYGPMMGECLSLKQAGDYHAASGVYGVPVMPGKADTGFISLGNDLFYVAVSGKANEKQYGYLKLMKLDRESYTFSEVE